MDLWKSESNHGNQTISSLACAAVGLLIMIGFRDFGNFGTNGKARFLLGLLLLLIGIPGFLLGGKQTVTIDPWTRRITIRDSNRFLAKTRTIPFTDIVGVSIGYLVKKSDFATCYYLVLKLRSGEDYPLFAPGRFFEGASDKSVVTGWKKRLEEYLGR